MRTVQAPGRVGRRVEEERAIERHRLLKKRRLYRVCLGSWLERWQSALSCVGTLGRGGSGSCRRARVSIHVIQKISKRLTVVEGYLVANNESRSQGKGTCGSFHLCARGSGERGVHSS